MKSIILVFSFISSLYSGQHILPSIEPSANVSVRFSVKSFLYGMVKGEFMTIEGVANFDKENLNASKFDFQINAASVETGKKMVNKFVSNEDFFSVKKYPSIQFKSTKLSKVNNTCIVEGELTLKGIKKNVQIPFIMAEKNGTITLTGNLQLNRFDFKIGENYKPFWIKKKVVIELEAMFSSSSIRKEVRARN